MNLLLYILCYKKNFVLSISEPKKNLYVKRLLENIETIYIVFGS